MKDWHHQAHEFLVGRSKKARALLWPMRSGKSKAIIDKADFNFNQHVINGAIVLAPCGVHLSWVLTHLPTHSRSGQYKAFAWVTPKRANFEQIEKLNALYRHPGMKWMTINKEALNHPDCQKAIRLFIKACSRKFMLIVDESHHFARPGAKRTRLARGLSKLAAIRQIATGTIILNSPLRAFSQYEILHPCALGFEMYKPFKEHFAVLEQRGLPNIRRKREVVVGYKNMDELREKMSKWSSVVVREDIHDMPDLIRTERPVVMSDLQRRAYLEMVGRHLVELSDGHTVSAREGGARVMKLHQIVMGYVVDETSGIHEVDPDAPIYDALIEQVGGTLPGKCIVWCRFREDVRRVVNKLEYNGYTGKVLEYHGGVPMDEREPLRLQFQNDPNIFVLVGTLGTGGEGLDFSAADAVIFFSVTPNTVQVVQGEERATAVGGKSVAVVRITTPGTVVDRLYDIIDNNSKLADSVSGRGLRELLLATDI